MSRPWIVYMNNILIMTGLFLALSELDAYVLGCSYIWLQEIVTRLGRWIDFRNDYKTLYPWFMESVW